MQYFQDIGSFVNGKQVFVGIDVHVKNWVVCTMCDSEVVEKTQIVADYSHLKNLLQKYTAARKISCVYEAGFSGFWLCRKLLAEGYWCIVTPPGQVPKTVTKVKTDKRDAEKLASYLSAGLLKRVWLPSAVLEADRRIIRRRSQLVKMQSRAKHQIRSFLHLREIVRPAALRTNWSKKYVAWLEDLHFAQASDHFTFAQLLKTYRRLRDDLAELTRYLRQMSRSDTYQKRFKLLASVRGVGLITGMTLLLEIFDFDRFGNTRQFASYLGLTPAQYSSGENVRLGHITRFGNANLRRVLVESAWTVIRHCPHLRAKYDRIRSRGANGKKAIVAVARSLAIRLRRGLLDGTGYVVGVA
jgi:transposase